MYLFIQMQKVLKRNNSYKKQRAQFKLWADFHKNIEKYYKITKNAKNDKIVNMPSEVSGFLSSINRRAKDIGCNRKNSIFQIIKQHKYMLDNADIDQTKKSVKTLYTTTSNKYNKISKYL